MIVDLAMAVLAGVGAAQVLAWIRQLVLRRWSRPRRPTVNTIDPKRAPQELRGIPHGTGSIMWPHSEYRAMLRLVMHMDRQRIHLPDPTDTNAKDIERLLTLLEDGCEKSLAEARELSPFRRAHLLN